MDERLPANDVKAAVFSLAGRTTPLMPGLHLVVAHEPIEIQGCCKDVAAEHSPDQQAGNHVANGENLHPQDTSRKGVVRLNSSNLVE